MSGIVEEAIEQRLDEDDSPGRLRALAAATVVGVGAAVLTYKLLRSGQDDEDDEDDESGDELNEEAS